MWFVKASLLCVAGLAFASPGLIVGPLDHSTTQPGPTIFRDTDGTYYIYSNLGALIRSSELTSGWEQAGPYVVNNNDGTPAKVDMSNPSVALIGSTYVMYYAANLNTYVATASNAEGPFTLTAANNGILLSNNGGAYMGSGTDKSAPAFFTHGGNNYILYKLGQPQEGDARTSIFLQAMTSDGLATTSASPVELFSVTPKNDPDSEGMQFQDAEGPAMTYHDGTFYLWFNAGVWCTSDYRISWATSTDLLQPNYTYGGDLITTGTYQGSSSSQKVSVLAPGTSSWLNTYTFAFMAYDPDARLSCTQGNSTGPGKYAYVSQVVYSDDGVPSLAQSWTPPEE